jgi:N-acetylglutamate synthase-like GNAT family acetyltransferase
VLDEMNTIRPFRPEDAQSCCILIQECLNDDSSLNPSLRQKLQENESPQTMEERAKLFYMAVYESESKIVGIVGLDLNEIRLLHVSPERRRSGIGRALFRHICEMTPDSFFSEIFVYSSLSAVDFYKAQGFIEKGQTIFDVGGEPMPTVFMACPTKHPPSM